MLRNHLVLGWLFFALVTCGPCLAAPPALAIVAPHGDWLTNYAADELARYTARLTSSSVERVVAASEANAPVVIALDLDARPELSRLEGGTDPQRVRDGFVIESQSNHRLRIAAAEPIGLLYGVYEYLEVYAHCGFFWDGEYLPRLQALPVEGIHAAVLPRWPRRVWYNLDSSFGFAKWHHGMRSEEQRHQVYDWFAKRRINLTSRLFIPDVQATGEVAEKVFGLHENGPSRFTYAGWPGDRSYSAEHMTHLIKDDLAYSRKRGIRWMYSLAYGRVPHEFRTTHPELKYLPNIGYNNTEIDPNQSDCELWTGRFIKALLDEYGTDHLYDVSPYCESTGADSPQASFDLKMKASQQLLKQLKELDPQAIWVTGSWDFYIMPKVWTKDHISTFLNSVPHQDFRIFDSMSNENPFYKTTSYFQGALWWYGILHSFQGDDHLHGDLAGDFKRLQDFAADPQATNCEGICICPESTGHNILYYDLLTHLSWNPHLQLDKFLDEFARRRYGAQTAPRLRAAWDRVIEAVYTKDHGQIPIYKKLAATGYPHVWPIIAENETTQTPELPPGIPQLREAVKLGLQCRPAAGENPLYENDMMDWMRTALAHQFNRATLLAYAAFKGGDVAQMNAQIDNARRCLHWIDMILSTRPDFSLQAQIDRVLREPGTNPEYAWGLKRYHINDEFGAYSATEAYEPLHFYYAPRMEVYFNELQARAARQIREIHWSDIAKPCAAIQQRWLEGDIHVPAGDRYPGSTLSCVAEALAVTERSY